MENFRYTLDNSSKKFVCPNCDKRRFVRYRDNETANYLADDYSRCDRQTNCNYHKAPPKGKKCFQISILGLKSITDKAFKLTDTNGIMEIVPKSQVFELTDKDCWITEWYLKQSKICYLGSAAKYFNDGKGVIVNSAKTITRPIMPASNHPIGLVDDMFCNHPINDNLTKFLKSRFSDDEVNRVGIDFLLTGTNHFWYNSTVFWQIDEKERIHGGKVMLYSPDTGRRVKEPYNHINWVHNTFKDTDFNLSQCLFGLHRINEDYQKTIGIVESEKTAIIMSIFLPDLIWLATGSKQNLKHELLKPLKRREIILFPDKGEFWDWRVKADELLKQGFMITVSQLIEKTGHPKGFDLADMYLYNKEIEKII